jgi:putative acetyltransferase
MVSLALWCQATAAMEAFIRPSRCEDNSAIAEVIRQVMTEHGAVGEGYSIQDPEVDTMHEAYAGKRSALCC